MTGVGIMIEELRKTIFVEVLVAILVVILIEPILKIFWGGISFLSNNIYSGLLDSIYRNVALGKRNYIDVMIFGLIVILAAIFTLTALWRTEIKRSITRIDNTVTRMPKGIGKITKIVLSICMVLVILYLLTSVFVDLQLNTSFEQRLTVLAPNISELDYKEIKAAWSNMESRGDYEIIQERMETLAEESGVELPEPLLK